MSAASVAGKMKTSRTCALQDSEGKPRRKEQLRKRISIFCFFAEELTCLMNEDAL